MQVDTEAARPGEEPASNGSPIHDSITVVEPGSSSAIPESGPRVASSARAEQAATVNSPAVLPGTIGQSSMQSSTYRSPLPEIRQNPVPAQIPAYAPSSMLAARPPAETRYHPRPAHLTTSYAAVAAGLPASASLPPSQASTPSARVAGDQARLTAAEKGKGRAAPYPSTMASTTILAQTPPAPYTPSTTSSTAGALAATDSLQGKRVPKKRRLSANGEIDPESLQSDGTLKKPRKRPSNPVAPASHLPYNGHASSSSSSHLPLGTAGAYYPGSGTDATPAPALSAADEAYLDRLERNAEKPYLTEMSGQCSLWATTRRALQGVAEYLRNPVMTDGASVEIGEGGIARGVILEGQEPEPKGFWGQRRMAGTMICAIGPARPRRIQRAAAGWGPKVEEGVSPGTDQEARVAGETASSRTVSSVAAEPEVPVVEALLAAHRLRRPVGVAVAQDYSSTSFKVPRPFVVLGWFWITAAWVEPEPKSLLAGCLPEDQKVRWRFRFDWCNEGDTLSTSELPWWPRVSDLKREILPAAIATPEVSDGDRNGEHSNTDVVIQHHPPVHGPPAVCACDGCHTDSTRLFAEMPVCLTEHCDSYFRKPRDRRKPSVGAVEDWVVRFVLTPLTMRADPSRLTPRALGLDLRPPEPQPVLTTGPGLATPGADFWRAWACKVCKMANERRRWTGWECESCKCLHQPQRPRYVPRELRQTRRPECFGPRQDDGSPLFPDGANIVRSWSLFEDDSKVVKYHTESLFGEGSELNLAMHAEGSSRQVHMQHALWIQNELLDRLQQQGRAEIPLRRFNIQLDPIRPAEKYLSPFYTLLYGPEPAPDIECFPTGAPVPWRMAPQLAIDITDYLNDRAGRMFPGESERFNLLLIVAFPPLLRHHPRFVLEPFTYTTLLVLGPDAEIRLRATSRPAPRTSGPNAKKQPLSKLAMQHGDVLGIRAGDDPLEITVSLESFGFLCIGRQVYRFPADKRDIEVQMRTDEEEERPVQATSAASGLAGDSADADALDNRPPPRPIKAAVAPLTNWYVGPRPLDPSQPIRTLPPLRDPLSPVAEAATEDAANTGVVLLDTEPEEPTLHSPAPTQPAAGSRKKQAEELQDLGIKKIARPRKPRQKRVGEVAGSERGSIGTPDASAMDVDPDTASQADVAADDLAGDDGGSVIEVKEESERSTPVSTSTSKRGGGRQSLGRGGKRGGSTAGSTRGAKRGRGKAKANN